MEHTGIEENQTHQQQHEPISFGIDQILNSASADPQSSSCMLPNRTAAEADYVYGYNGVYNPACSMAAAGLPAGSYNVNMNMNVSMNMNMNVNVNSAGGGGGGGGGGAGGVIRVPAHRPMPPPPPPPPAAIAAATAPHPPPSCIGSVPGMGMGNAANFTFPWMESSRRFAKDRLTGKQIVPSHL